MDGVHVLRKRSNTRLWYRQLPGFTVPSQRIINSIVTEAETARSEREIEDAWERLFAQLADEPAVNAPLPAAVAPIAPPVAAATVPAVAVGSVHQPVHVQVTVKLTPEVKACTIVDTDGEEWRTVPAGAPSLLLSATNLLDARNPGPVLHPGVRYRIAGVQNGVIGLDVVDPDGEEGDSGLGYCSAVDLICIDRRFAGYQSGQLFDPSGHTKSRVTRLTGSLTNATSSLLSVAASGSRLFF